MSDVFDVGYSLVFFVRADEFDENQLDLRVKFKLGNEPVFVAGDVENNSIVAHIVCRVENRYYFLRVMKNAVFDDIVPKLQRNSRIGIKCSKFFQSLFGNDSHGANVRNFPIWEYNLQYA
jgi:hypothetical protein